MKLEWLASKRFVLLVALACVAACTNATGALWDSRLLIGAARTEFPPGYGVGGNLVDLRYAGNGLPGAEGCLWSASDPFAWFFRCPGRRAESGVWKANLQERNEGIYLDQGPATSHWSWPLAVFSIATLYRFGVVGSAIGSMIGYEAPGGPLRH